MSTDIERTRHAAKVMSEYADYCEKHGKPPKVELSRRGTAEWCGKSYPRWDWDHSDYRLVPDPPLVVEVGGWYETRQGKAALVARKSADPIDEDQPFFAVLIDERDHEFFGSDGRWNSATGDHPYDLIRRIDAPDFAKAWARDWLGNGPEVRAHTLAEIVTPVATITPELRAWLIEHGATIKE